MGSGEPKVSKDEGGSRQLPLLLLLSSGAAGSPPLFWELAALWTTQQPHVQQGSGLGRGFTPLVDECF